MILKSFCPINFWIFLLLLNVAYVDGNSKNDNNIVPTPRISPTDPSGKYIYPIISSDGILLPTDEIGNYIDMYGEPIETDGYGIPLERRYGEPLPTNSIGQYIYPQKSDETPPPPTIHMIPEFLDPVAPTDPCGYLLNPNYPDENITYRCQLELNGSSDSMNVDETYAFQEPPAPEFPTDTSGKIVYPVIGSDGALLSTDATGVHLDENGEPINIHSNGLPLGPNGEFLPTNPIGQFIYPDPTIDIFSDKSVITLVCVEPIPQSEESINGPTAQSNFDGSPFPTNEKGTLIGPNGSPLPKHADGNFMYGSEKSLIPTNPSEINPTTETLLSSSGTETDKQFDNDNAKNAEGPLRSFLDYFYKIHY